MQAFYFVIIYALSRIRTEIVIPCPLSETPAVILGVAASYALELVWQFMVSSRWSFQWILTNGAQILNLFAFILFRRWVRHARQVVIGWLIKGVSAGNATVHTGQAREVWQHEGADCAKWKSYLLHARTILLAAKYTRKSARARQHSFLTDV